MSIIRVVKHDKYVVVDKDSVEDPRLTFKATGLLTFLLGKPNDWTISYRGLAKMKADGEHSIRQALKELARFGYLHRQRVQQADGTFAWEQILYEVPSVENPRTVAAIIPARKTAALTNNGLSEVPPSPAKRGQGATPRAKGTNPRSQGTNPRSVAKREREAERERIKNCTRCNGMGFVEVERGVAAPCICRDPQAGVAS